VKDRNIIPNAPLPLLLAGLTALLCALVVWSAGAGYVRVPAGEVLRHLIHRAPAGQPGALNPVVIREVRLPRIAAAAAVGGGLALSGAVFQGILMNPLADPYTLGVSAGAAFGAGIALWLRFERFGAHSVPLAAFAGAVATLAAVILLSSASGGLGSSNLILAGIIVSAILSAGVSFVKFAADEEVALIVAWLMGSLSGRTWGDLLPLAAVLAIGFPLCLFFARDLNLLALGRHTAASLGVAPERVSLLLLLAASLIAAVCVSISGIIGFVGLLVPHLMRTLTGPDHRRLLPAVLLAGAILLLGADTVTRALLPQELPVGVLTALLGGPFFCWVFRRQSAGRLP
jgi:iron complex transport system permease protein